jgi:hypothetical protein
VIRSKAKDVQYTSAMFLLGIPDKLPVIVPSAQSVKNGAKTADQRQKHITVIKLATQKPLPSGPFMVETNNMNMGIVNSPTRPK